jgi:probable rRNA maturation factor
MPQRDQLHPAEAHLHLRGKAVFRARGRLRLMRLAARAALAQSQAGGACEWSIRLTDDAELRQLNLQFRGMDKPTDVLSFGGERYRDGKPAGRPLADPPEPVEVESEGAEYLGDIVISVDRCVAQAKAGGHRAEDELALLVVHGTLHLLGYDHDTKARKARMWSAQTRALRSMGVDIDVP